jgi:hypothetical protein
MYRPSLRHKDLFSTATYIVDLFTKFMPMYSLITVKNLRNGRHIIYKSVILHTPSSLSCADAAISTIVEV